MTLNEIAYNILNTYRGGRLNHNEHISLEQVKFTVKYYRAMMIRRDMARNGFVSNGVEQDINCLELEIIDASKCCNLETNCSVYRTKKLLPKFVRLNFNDAITYAGDATGLNSYQIIEPHLVQWLPYDKYTSSKKKVYILDNYLYLYNGEGDGLINVRGIFEDPEKLNHFTSCEGIPCYDDNSEYPLPMDMLQMLTQGILGGEMKILAVSVNDTVNDAAQDGGGPPPPSNKGKQ
jgi:hypothetical protein